MPLYVFESNDGERIDLEYPMKDAPSIGSVIKVDGRQFTRIPSFHIDTAGIARKTHQYPFVSRSLPKWSVPDSHDAMGRPIIRSQAHERSTLDRLGYVRE